MQIFIDASRFAYRYPSDRGLLTTEQLWELPLRSHTGFDLNSVAISLNQDLKALGEESFVDADTDSAARTLLEAKLDIVKHVITFKQLAAKAATERAAKAALQIKLRNLIENKKDEQLSSASIEELEAQLAALA
jgi:hypothetical protein